MHKLTVALLPLVCGVLPGQTTWYPPANADLAPYIAQAAPGDILQLASMHPPFVLDKGLVLAGPSTIRRPLGPSQSAIAIPPGQQARLHGLSFQGWTDGYRWYHHGVTIRGDVSIEDSIFDEGQAQVVTGAVILQRCRFGSREMSLPLSIQGGTCAMTDCVLTGWTVIWPYWITSKPGLHQSGGTLIGSRLTITGGGGAFFGMNYDASPALVKTGGTAFLTDCTLAGGPGVSIPGASALASNGGLSVARTALVPGTGTPPGPAPTGYLDVPEMVGMRASGALVRGQGFTATATAGSSQEALVVIANFDATAYALPPLVEPLFGDPANLLVLAVAVPAPSATIPVTLQVPNDAALSGAGVWFQAVQFHGAVLHASTPVGGAIR